MQRACWQAASAPIAFIADGCNGLATVGLFIGFIIAYPGTAWRRALFLSLGALAIYLANTGRTASTVLFQKYWAAAFDVMHGFGMTALFALRVLWAIRATPYPPRARGTVVALLQHGPASAQKTPIRNPARWRRFPLVPFGRRTACQRTASLAEDISSLPLYSRKPLRNHGRQRKDCHAYRRELRGRGAQQ